MTSCQSCGAALRRLIRGCELRRHDGDGDRRHGTGRALRLFVHAVQSGEISADWPSLPVLAGTRALFAQVFGISAGAFVTALAIFFLLCGLRAVLRRDWLAAALASVLLAMQSSDLRNSDYLAVAERVY